MQPSNMIIQFTINFNLKYLYSCILQGKPLIYNLPINLVLHLSLLIDTKTDTFWLCCTLKNTLSKQYIIPKIHKASPYLYKMSDICKQWFSTTIRELLSREAPLHCHFFPRGHISQCKKNLQYYMLYFNQKFLYSIK